MTWWWSSPTIGSACWAICSWVTSPAATTPPTRGCWTFSRRCAGPGRTSRISGADPDNIMVWGESGGGAKTAAIYTMPDAARLFHKASIESAAPLRFPTRDGATARARRTLELLGLTTANIAQLHDIPAGRLLEIQQSEAANGVAPWGDPPPLPGFGAFVDGTVIPRHPFADGVASFSAVKPLMCGTCRG